MRHAQTAYNFGGLSQGSSDIELNEEGHRQADAVGRHLAGMGIEKIFSSDLKRAVQTAVAIQEQCQCPLELSPLLRERSLGQLEGVTLHALRQAYEDEVLTTGKSMYEVRPGESESAYDVMERASFFFKSCPLEHSTAVVTHGMMAETILAHLIGASPECTRSFQFDNASVTILERDIHPVWVLRTYNDTSFL